jgi:predicted TIM-barrel fold metal-dependent hydrolase
MILDADTHIAPTEGQFLIERHIENLDRAGISRSLTWLAPLYSTTERDAVDAYNRYVYEAARKYPNRILGFGWADPTLGVEQAKADARRCVEQYGFYGVKLNGAQNNFYIDDPELSLPVIEEIARLKTNLAFHIGPDAYERTHPLRAAKVASTYPELPILMVHMGMNNPEMSRAVVEVAAECPNMILIGSQTTDSLVLEAIGKLGAPRVCFGTDSPFQRMHVVRAMYDAFLSGEVSQADKALIMGGNIARLFDLKD